jgi:hypothetical protein
MQIFIQGYTSSMGSQSCYTFSKTAFASKLAYHSRNQNSLCIKIRHCTLLSLFPAEITLARYYYILSYTLPLTTRPVFVNKQNHFESFFLFFLIVKKLSMGLNNHVLEEMALLSRAPMHGVRFPSLEVLGSKPLNQTNKSKKN